MVDDVDVLLVEDSLATAELMLRGLRRGRPEARCHVVRDGEEALEFLLGQGRYAGRDATTQPKLVMLDLRMPRMDGLEVLRRIRASECCRLTPVIMMTASESVQDARGSYEMGANGYVVKPMEFDQLLDALALIGAYWLGLNRPV